MYMGACYINFTYFICLKCTVINLQITALTNCSYKGEGVGGGMEWEVGVSRCKLLHIEWINNKVLQYSTENYIQYLVIGTSLVAQWVRLHAPNAGGPGSTPGRETRSCMHVATNKSQHAAIKSLHAATKESARRN